MGMNKQPTTNGDNMKLSKKNKDELMDHINKEISKERQYLGQQYYFAHNLQQDLKYESIREECIADCEEDLAFMQKDCEESLLKLEILSDIHSSIWALINKD
jgi:GTPase Era involved in 16S rRNA processing